MFSLPSWQPPAYDVLGGEEGRRQPEGRRVPHGLAPILPGDVIVDASVSCCCCGGGCDNMYTENYMALHLSGQMLFGCCEMALQISCQVLLLLLLLLVVDDDDVVVVEMV